MVIGWLTGEVESGGAVGLGAGRSGATRSALPCLLVPEPAHAVLAGELAAGLVAASFGESHLRLCGPFRCANTSSASSDARPIQRLRSGGAPASHAAPVSLFAIPPGEVAEAWTA